MNNPSFLLAFSAGLVSFISPCVLPLIPGYLSLITGVSVFEAQEKGGTEAAWRSLAPTLLFVLGFSAVFIGLGGAASAVGAWLKNYQDLLVRLGGVLIVLMGLFLMGGLPLGFLYRERRFHVDGSRFGRWGLPLAGAAFALGWTPCVGPVLGAVLAMAGTAQTVGRGMLLLAAYSLGMALPFLLSGLLFTRFLSFSKSVRRHYALITGISGGLLIAVGILMALGRMTWISRLVQGLF